MKLYPLETRHCPGCGTEMGICFAHFGDGCRQMRTCPACNGPVSEGAKQAGDALRSRRIGAGLTLRNGAEVLGYSPSALSAMEVGRDPLTLEDAVRLALRLEEHAGREGG